MGELYRKNPKYVQTLNALRHRYHNLGQGLMVGARGVVDPDRFSEAERDYYRWKWLPPDQPVWSDHPLWQANVALARRCAELDACMSGDESNRADLYATDMTGVVGPQDFPEQTLLSDEKDRHHYLCAWLAAALSEVS